MLNFRDMKTAASTAETVKIALNRYDKDWSVNLNVSVCVRMERIRVWILIVNRQVSEYFPKGDIC